VNTATHFQGRIFHWLLGVLAVAIAIGANAQSYTATYLGTLGGGSATAIAMNNAGVIVGYSNTVAASTVAFSYSNGSMSNLGTLGGQDSFAYAINNSGIIVGVSNTTVDQSNHAFIYSNGTMTDLGTLGGATSTAYGINDAGTIVGSSDINANVEAAFSYSNGTMTNLGSFGGTITVAKGINNSGTIVGSSTNAQGAGTAFSYSNGTMTNLGTLGGPSSDAVAINDEGTIVGNSSNTANNAIDVFIYSNGTMTDLGNFNGLPTYPAAINNSGVIVGATNDRAFVYSNGTFSDLNSLVDLPNETLAAASSINDAGQIVASTFLGGSYLLTPIPSVSSTRLINISTRAQVGTGDNILIPGFVISGSGIETLLIRADGPSLSQFSVPGVLAQPRLSVFNSAGAVIASNTGWGTNSNPSQISSVSAQIGAFALAPGSADCALIVSLPAGAYTAQVSGANNTTGVALAEVYEVSSTGTRLVNISTRAQVGTGANIIIPGFVVTGGGTEQLLARADGPSLTQFGVAGVLAQPSLSILNSAANVVAYNTWWVTGFDADEIPGIAASVGAFPFETGSVDSAQIVRLSAGAYTMQVSGVENTTGVALAEVYEVP
jgi:probable HAF family extracellular repeat protein